MKNGNQQATNPPKKIYKTFIKINNKVISIIYILTIYHLSNNRYRSTIIITRINVIILKIMNQDQFWPTYDHRQSASCFCFSSDSVDTTLLMTANDSGLFARARRFCLVGWPVACHTVGHAFRFSRSDTFRTFDLRQIELRFKSFPNRVQKERVKRWI